MTGEYRDEPAERLRAVAACSSRLILPRFRSWRQLDATRVDPSSMRSDSRWLWGRTTNHARRDDHVREDEETKSGREGACEAKVASVALSLGLP
jgi:hypothetical protein